MLAVCRAVLVTPHLPGRRVLNRRTVSQGPCAGQPPGQPRGRGGPGWGAGAVCRAPARGTGFDQVKGQGLTCYPQPSSGSGDSLLALPHARDLEGPWRGAHSSFSLGQPERSHLGTDPHVQMCNGVFAQHENESSGDRGLGAASCSCPPPLFTPREMQARGTLGLPRLLHPSCWCLENSSPG